MNLSPACTARKTWFAPHVQIARAANAQSALVGNAADGNLDPIFNRVLAS
jgi:hypothetical protein